MHNERNYKQHEKRDLRVGENNNKWRSWQRISKLYKQLIQFDSRKINDPVKKCTKELNIHFSKEDIQMANKHMIRCSTSLIVREMKSKSQWGTISWQSEWLLSKGLHTINAEKRNPPYTMRGNAKYHNHYGVWCGDSLKIRK